MKRRTGKKALRGCVLIDGVHKPDNSIAGTRVLMKEHKFVPKKFVWIGGTEKIKSAKEFRATFRKEFGVDIIMEGDVSSGKADAVRGISKALEDRQIDLVVQLSGSPQVNQAIMQRYASVAISFGVKYIAGGTTFAEKRSDIGPEKPSFGLFATDKRVGKTAFGIYVGCLASGLRGKKTPWSAIVMTHSRGGPPHPPTLHIYRKPKREKDASKLSLKEIYNQRFKPEFLEALLKMKLHGASDVYEDGLIISEYLTEWEKKNKKEGPKISVVGCRRSGAGFFHEFAVSNVDEGLKIANKAPGNYITHEGSGGEHPPVHVDGNLHLIPSNMSLEQLEQFPGIEATDLFIMVHAQRETASAKQMNDIEKILRRRNPRVKIIRTYFEPEIIGDTKKIKKNIKGKNVYYLTTAPEYAGKKIKRLFEEKYGCKVIGISHNLSKDAVMRKDINAAATAKKKPEYFLIEIKARGVEGAKLIREKYGIPVCYVNNIPQEVTAKDVRVGGNPGLNKAVIDVLKKAEKRWKR